MLVDTWSILTRIVTYSWNFKVFEYKLIYLIAIGVVTGTLGIFIHGRITFSNTTINNNFSNGSTNEVKNKEKFIKQRGGTNNVAKSSTQYKSGSFSRGE